MGGSYLAAQSQHRRQPKLGEGSIQGPCLDWDRGYQRRRLDHVPDKYDACRVL
jgi:hypothetical protein